MSREEQLNGGGSSNQAGESKTNNPSGRLGGWGFNHASVRVFTCLVGPVVGCCIFFLLPNIRLDRDIHGRMKFWAPPWRGPQAVTQGGHGLESALPMGHSRIYVLFLCALFAKC
jgi:hypothetical protein